MGRHFTYVELVPVASQDLVYQIHYIVEDVTLNLGITESETNYDCPLLLRISSYDGTGNLCGV